MHAPPLARRMGVALRVVVAGWARVMLIFVFPLAMRNPLCYILAMPQARRGDRGVIEMIHANTYRAYRRRIDAYDAWAEQFVQANGWIVIPAGAKPPVKVTNDMRSAVEVYEFCKRRPGHYFMYINDERRVATTWTGDKLGNVEFGREYRDNFGGKRVPVTVRAINGLTYHGTFFKSAGDYARVKAAKERAA